MAFSGVRSSCESVARNSSFIRAARCAAMPRIALGFEQVLPLGAFGFQGLGALAFGEVARDLGEPAKPSLARRAAP